MSTLRKRRTSRPVKLDVRRLRIRLHLATNDRETGREPSDCLGCEIWVQAGCNKNSRGLLEAPKVAIGAVRLSLNAGLSRQRSRVRVSSSPPFFSSTYTLDLFPTNPRMTRARSLGLLSTDFNCVQIQSLSLNLFIVDHMYVDTAPEPRPSGRRGSAGLITACNLPG